MVLLKELVERLTRVEILLNNHLKSHERMIQWFLWPLLVGVALILIRVFMLRSPR